MRSGSRFIFQPPRLVATLAGLVALAASHPAYIRPGTDVEEHVVEVDRVIDGDTFKDAEGRSYRLVGVNAPEIAHPEHGKPDGEPGGEEAAEYLCGLIEGRTVTVLIDRAHATDRYGRTVGVVLLGDPAGGEVDVNAEMIRAGHAEFRYIDLSPMLDEEAFCAAPWAAPSSPAGAEPSSHEPPGAEAPPAAASQGGTPRDPPEEPRQAEPLSAAPVPANDASSAALLPTAPAPTSAWSSDTGPHVLAPGDKVRVVVGPQEQDFTVNPEGEILIRGLGVVRVAEKTAADASADLDTAIRAKGYNVSPITVFYLAPPTRLTRNVVVLGAVRNPGTVQASTLLSAISATSGYLAEANPAEVRITKGDSSTLVNLGEIVSGLAPDRTLDGGEVVFIPALPRVLVSGGVSKPGWVNAVALTEAVSAAGGVILEADLTRAEIRGRGETATVLDLQAVMSGRATDPRLSDRDRVTVPIRPRSQIPLASVYGPIRNPGTVEAFSLADAVREATPDSTADLAHVLIDRNGETAVVDARAVALGHAPDVDLHQGDRVLIPQIGASAAPGETPTAVVVNGDVGKPGIVSAGRLTEVIARAGGVTNTAMAGAIYVRLPDGSHSHHSITRGRDDPYVPDGASVFVPSATKTSQFIRNLTVIAGVALRLFTISL